MARVDRVSQNSFNIVPEWIHARGVVSPELSATWCTLSISVDGETVTLIEDLRNDSVRRRLYTSAYPLAEWIAQRWWSLRVDMRPSADPDAHNPWSVTSRHPWIARHNLRAAGNGMAWPDLTIIPGGNAVELRWHAGPALGDQPVRFLSSGHRLVSATDVLQSLAEFVEVVLDRLNDAGVTDTLLHQEWRALERVEDEEEQFVNAAARLGLDPFDVDPPMAESIIMVAEMVDPGVLNEFFNTARPAQINDAAMWLGSALQQVPLSGGRRAPELKDIDLRTTDRPWSIGYAAARRVRQQLELQVTMPFDIEQFVGLSEFRSDAGGLLGLATSNQGTVALVTPRHGSESSERFARARALGLTNALSRRVALLESSRTTQSRFAGAFAAELLAPAAGIREYLEPIGTITEDSLEFAADHFRVSPDVVKYQYQNQMTGFR